MAEENKQLEEQNTISGSSFKDLIEQSNKKTAEKLDFTVTIAQLMEAGVQFGHHPSETHSTAKKYIFPMTKKEASNTVIIDLDKTLSLLEKACKFLEERVGKGDNILWIGTKNNSSSIIEEQAKRSGSFFMNVKWFGGFLTNFKTVLETLNKRSDTERICQNFKEGIKIITKKEYTSKNNTLEKNKLLYKGIENMQKLPNLIILADLDQDQIIVKEANKLNIPIIKICDSNSNIKGVDFVIPGNDDSQKSLQLILTTLGDFCVSGTKIKAVRQKNQDINKNNSGIKESFNKDSSFKKPFKRKIFIKPKNSDK